VVIIPSRSGTLLMEATHPSIMDMTDGSTLWLGHPTVSVLQQAGKIKQSRYGGKAGSYFEFLETMTF
jgi:hypothetical protein